MQREGFGTCTSSRALSRAARRSSMANREASIRFGSSRVTELEMTKISLARRKQFALLAAAPAQASRTELVIAQIGPRSDAPGTPWRAPWIRLTHAEKTAKSPVLPLLLMSWSTAPADMRPSIWVIAEETTS